MSEAMTSREELQAPITITEVGLRVKKSGPKGGVVWYDKDPRPKRHKYQVC